MTLYHNIEGEGATLILLHGWALNRHVWVNVSNKLALNNRVLNVDLPGHGRSPSIQPYTLSSVVDAVVSVIENDSVNRQAADQAVTIIGWSLGGLIAMQLAISYPNKLRKLVVLAASAQFVANEQWPYGVQKHILLRFSTDLLRDHKATILRFLAIQSIGSDHAKTEIRALKKQLFVDGEPDQEALIGGLQILQTSQLQPNLSEITCPTLMLVGERDALVHAEACYLTAKSIPNCEVITIAGAGHAIFISHPLLLIQSLEKFLT